MMFRKQAVGGFLALMVGGLPLSAAFAQGGAADAAPPAQETPAERFITLGTGGVTGVYYPAGGAIQLLVNRNRADHGVRITVESTGGSIFNINALKEGELDIGVVQSDWHYHAVNGSKKPFEEPFPALRSLFSLHPEPFTIVARAGADIEALEDLPGKRINIGNPGSGQRATWEVVAGALGWEDEDFSQLTGLTSSEQSQALCDNNFDAMVFAAGHPSGSIQEASATCDIKLIPVTGPKIEALVADNPFYATATIPGGTYEGNPSDVQTFGVRATLVTTQALPDHVANTLVRAVFQQFAIFQRAHPTFRVLKKEEMVREALTAPLHPGAEAYYQEAGLIGE